MPPSAGGPISTSLLLLLLGCDAPTSVPPVEVTPRGDAPAFEAPAPVLKRLTAVQYGNTIGDIFGTDLLIPDDLEPDTEVNGLYAVGASVASVSSRGVEQYETAAYLIAGQALQSAAARARLVPCTPAGPVDDACARLVLEPLARRVWRRPATAAELTTLVGLGAEAGAVLGDFYLGLEYPVAALLQSPHFLYREELGEADPADPASRRYTDDEMATRLAFFLWNTTPDDLLLDAAAARELTTDAGLSAQLDRMLADDRIHEGVANYFTEMFTLYKLDALSKDPTIYTHMSEEVGPAARQETLLDLDWLVFEEQGDYRDILTTQHTFIDRKLAAIYAVPAPARDGFAATTLPESGGRRGLLGQVSFLAQAAHPTFGSPTRRGVFVREVLLCQPMQPPPANLNTAIPEASPDLPTMRARLEQHLEDPYCAACHRLTDYVGLGLENFDGLGGWRDTENGVTIDPSGDLDGVAFSDAWALAGVIHDHEDLGPCLARTLYQYAGARPAGEGDEPQIDWHADGLAESGYDVQFSMRDLVMGPAFRRAGEVR